MAAPQDRQSGLDGRDSDGLGHRLGIGEAVTGTFRQGPGDHRIETRGQPGGAE